MSILEIILLVLLVLVVILVIILIIIIRSFFKGADEVLKHFWNKF